MVEEDQELAETQTIHISLVASALNDHGLTGAFSGTVGACLTPGRLEAWHRTFCAVETLSDIRIRFRRETYWEFHLYGRRPPLTRGDPYGGGVGGFE